LFTRPVIENDSQQKALQINSLAGQDNQDFRRIRFDSGAFAEQTGGKRIKMQVRLHAPARPRLA
jgi:hypothetical protein